LHNHVWQRKRNDECFFTVTRTQQFFAKPENLFLFKGLDFASVFLGYLVDRTDFHSVTGNFFFEDPLKTLRVLLSEQAFSSCLNSSVILFIVRELELFTNDTFSRKQAEIN
jgi:hypothetical protein